MGLYQNASVTIHTSPAYSANKPEGLRTVQFIHSIRHQSSFIRLAPNPVAIRYRSVWLCPDAGAGFDKSAYPKLAAAYPSGVIPECVAGRLRANLPVVGPYCLRTGRH